MTTAPRIASFVGFLVLVLAGAAFAGARIDPKVEEEPAHKTDDHGGEEGPAPSGESVLPGLSISDGGHRLEIESTTLPANRAAALEFKIVTDGGDRVRSYDETHERRMHLILVRRDFQGFQHLHPEQLADGSWSVKTDPMAPGTYRMFTDFSTGGRSLTLGGDLFVAGEFSPRPLPPVATTANAGDGYEVIIESPAPRAGETVPTEFTVRREGKPVADIEPYLGADGHLVALRDGDLAFLHTHPEGEAGGPGPIRFQVNYPSEGRYRLYLQFKHDGEVRTAEFTQVAGPAVDGQENDTPEAHTEGGH